jgi:hypothetical protein
MTLTGRQLWGLAWRVVAILVALWLLLWVVFVLGVSTFNHSGLPRGVSSIPPHSSMPTLPGLPPR